MTTLGDLYEITSSKRVFRSEWTRSGVPFYRAREIVKLSKDGFVDNELFISQDMYDLYSRKHGVPKEDDLLVTGVGTLGICYVVRADDQFYFKDGNIIWLKNRGVASSQFIKYAFLSDLVRRQIHDSVGATVATYTITRAKGTRIPLPPFPEQERIVAILDEAFAAIATATANSEKNLANARELFDAFFADLFTAKADKWPRRTLAELLELGWIVDHMDGNHGSDYPRKHEFIDDGVPYISANCIADDIIDMARAKYLSPERATRLRKGFAQDGDVLFAHNATVGPVAILNTNYDTVILGTSLTHYRCDREFISSRYLAHYMRSLEFVRQYELVMRQSTRNQVPITKQREFTHIIPPIEDQRAIAEVLDDLRTRISALERVYHARLTLLTELKKSILHKAFTGELTADRNAAERTLKEASV